MSTPETYGIRVEKESPQEVAVLYASRESRIQVSLVDGPRDPDLKEKIRTPSAFLNHMLETLAWRACLNLAVACETFGYPLAHVSHEDTGWTVGAAFARLLVQRVPHGVRGTGGVIEVMDEAMCRCALSFEQRGLCRVDWHVPIMDRVEDTNSNDLTAFLEGLTQGGRLTLHADMLKGRDPHHLWEVTFRALGEALRQALEPCPWRAGTTPGVKGF
jgi:imidazoleglycerol-phosphate dehydratase